MLKLDSEALAADRLARRRSRPDRPAPGTSTGRVIRLKERNLIMLTKDLILRNPLRLLGQENEDIVGPGRFGAVLARAGVGKTALIVQIALNTMLRGRNVLHISLNEPVGKVDIWYREVVHRLAQHYQVNDMQQLWDTMLPHRLIMTFQVEGFSLPKLQERLTDLTAQNIFQPDMIIIDGYPFDPEAHPLLEALKDLAGQLAVPVWFTVTTHRHEAPAEDGLPIQLSPVQDLFDVAIALQPKGETVFIEALKGCTLPEAQPPLVLDPATMLIRTQAEDELA